MYVNGRFKGFFQGPRGALSHQQARRRVEKIQEAKQILRALSHWHIAADSSDSHHVQLRRGQGQENGQGVIDAGVGINNDFGWRSLLHA